MFRKRQMRKFYYRNRKRVPRVVITAGAIIIFLMIMGIVGNMDTARLR